MDAGFWGTRTIFKALRTCKLPVLCLASGEHSLNRDGGFGMNEE